MRIVNLNTENDIGANSWFVEIEGHRLILDAGMHPKKEGRKSLPDFRLVNHEDVDAIAISHCHHDHVGALPVTMRHFPKAHVLMTELSYFLTERVLHNSVNVMTRQRDELGIKDYPLYTHFEVDECAPRIQGYKYNREIEWAGFHRRRSRGGSSPTLEFVDAGHALGAAGIMVRGNKETLFYTGDTCFHDQTLLKAADFNDVKADVLLMETTRGSRATPDGFSREDEIDRLGRAIAHRVSHGGSVLIPAFALGRTQEILAMLALMMKSGKLRRQPVYIGGLGRVFTEIYDIQAHRTSRFHTNLVLNEALSLIVLEREQINSIKLSRGHIFVVTAGMMSENTPAHDLTVRMAQDPMQSIFFVGYADPDTPGGRFKAAKDGETFLFSGIAGNITRRCEVLDFDLTAHATREELLDFVGEVAPRKVLLGHGSDESRNWFEDQIRTKHPKMKVIQPDPGETCMV